MKALVVEWKEYDLKPVDIDSIGKGDPDWRVFAKNKAFCRVRFNPDECGCEATTKIKYRHWAESHSIIFGE